LLRCSKNVSPKRQMRDTFQADVEQNSKLATLQRLNGSARSSRLHLVCWHNTTIFLELSLTLGLTLHISIIVEMWVSIMSDKINVQQVIEALGALAHEHRLALFRLLVQAGADGMPAGAIAETLSLPNSSLSFHLAHLTRSGLIQQTRQSRSLIYTADYAAMNGLIGYLMENCCGGVDCAPDADCEPASIKTLERNEA
jgi:ArsR family transcriptional regulator, arsenate/arsenite/antimonite-responsive transcriptional repressor